VVGIRCLLEFMASNAEGYGEEGDLEFGVVGASTDGKCSFSKSMASSTCPERILTRISANLQFEIESFFETPALRDEQ
jgi:hypothetical protein